MTADKNNDHTMDSLLVKYMLGETTATEKALAEQWIHGSPEQEKYFEQLKQLWQTTSRNIVSPPVDDAWERFLQRREHTTKTRSSQTILLRRLAAAAAVLLILIVGGKIMYQSFHPAAKLFTLSSGNGVLTDTLADKSIVTLNKNSKLLYPLQFTGKSRSVRLEGEAFFDVAQQNSHPFIVHIKDLTVTVLGTSFNIDAEGDSTEIIVASGSVKVTGKNNAVQLQAHERAVFSPGTGLLIKMPVDNKLYNYYRTQVFSCDNTPLQELVVTLNKAYSSNIVITNPELEDLRITTTFHHSQPLDSILAIIRQTFSQVSISREGNRIIIK